MASLASEDSLHRGPYSSDTVAPTDLNKTATELADWLLLITQMLKSNIVTVGDIKEIRTTIGRLQGLASGIFSVSVDILASDHHAQLDSELKEVQVSLKELESFLRWLQEAETTVTVLSDTSQREDVSQDSAHVKELRQQLEVGLEMEKEKVCVSNLCTGASLLSQCHPSLTNPSPR
ncbi:hypothetical protein XENOCAPTIV_030512 [Xenoophorus captivus]|uniref:Uncharacterized protein n=1 Tax=Xenoophorus captivus TaxID=1517983 RepID=A0ABV0QNU3_9TELE